MPLAPRLKGAAFLYMEPNKRFFHTINLKCAVALATLGFKMNKPPVTRLVRTDGNPVTVCWTFDTCESCAGPASVNENTEVVSNLRVYPNPAEDLLNVQFNAAVAARMSLRMVNSLGQVVVEENLGQISGQKTLTLQTSNLASGVYALSLTNGTQVQLVNVLIK
jgi:hypothetical protein